MSAQQAAESLAPGAQLDEAQQEIARLNAELKARTEELERERAARTPEVAPILREVKRRFARFISDRVNLGHQERHRGDLSSWSPELFRAAGEIGLIGLGADPRAGGDGRDPFTTGIMLEEVAKLAEDPGFPYLLSITKVVANTVAAAGTPEQIDRFARPLLKGECMAVVAHHEFAATDPAFRKSVAKKVDGKWVLSGSKAFSAGARYAGVIMASLREEVSGETFLFLLRLEDPGVKLTPFETIGGRYHGYAMLTMDEVCVEEDRLIPDKAFITRPIWEIWAIYLGWMQRTLDLAIETLRPRVRAGMSFLSIPHVQSEIGRLHLGIEATRSMFLRVLEKRCREADDPSTDLMTLALKYFVARQSIDTAQTLMQLLGAESYLDKNPWGRYLTDVISTLYAGGAQDLIPQIMGERYLMGLEFRKLRKFSM